MTRPLLIVVALLLALVGCGTPSALAPQSAGAGTVEVGTEGVIPAPVAVSIPAIGAESSLIPLGLNPDGSAAVPPLDQPWQASWLEPGVIPGQPGPAVLYGHISGRVDGRSVPGVFARLSELEPGDRVVVDRFDAEPLAWQITRVETHDKETFPTEAVYGDTAGPELRLVSCGGTFDPTTGHYEANVIAFAVPA